MDWNIQDQLRESQDNGNGGATASLDFLTVIGSNPDETSARITETRRNETADNTSNVDIDKILSKLWSQPLRIVLPPDIRQAKTDLDARGDSIQASVAAGTQIAKPQLDEHESSLDKAEKAFSRISSADIKKEFADLAKESATLLTQHGYKPSDLGTVMLQWTNSSQQKELAMRSEMANLSPQDKAKAEAVVSELGKLNAGEISSAEAARRVSAARERAGGANISAELDATFTAMSDMYEYRFSPLSAGCEKLAAQSMQLDGVKDGPVAARTWRAVALVNASGTDMERADYASRAKQLLTTPINARDGLRPVDHASVKTLLGMPEFANLKAAVDS